MTPIYYDSIFQIFSIVFMVEETCNVEILLSGEKLGEGAQENVR